MTDAANEAATKLLEAIKDLDSSDKLTIGYAVARGLLSQAMEQHELAVALSAILHSRGIVVAVVTPDGIHLESTSDEEDVVARVIVGELHSAVENRFPKQEPKD